MHSGHTCRAILAAPSQSAVSPTRRLYAAATVRLAPSPPPPSVGAAAVSSAERRPDHMPMKWTLSSGKVSQISDCGCV